MEPKASHHFVTDFRRFFLRGLAALVPTLLTIAILVWVYSLVNGYLGVHITRGLVLLCSQVSDAPAPGLVTAEDALTYGTPLDEWDDTTGRRLTEEYKILHHPAVESDQPGARRRANLVLWDIAARKYRFHLIGFVIAIVLVYFTGFFLASFIGRTFWRGGERLLLRLPVIRSIYPNVKQVTDFLLSDRPVEYSGVVAVQYPRVGVWSIGLSTGGPLKGVQTQTKAELVTVFVPSSPTPITGYVVQVPRDEVIELNMTIEEAFRFAISGGVIKPDTLLPEASKGEPRIASDSTPAK